MYASFLGISGALHLSIFQQPAKASSPLNSFSLPADKDRLTENGRSVLEGDGKALLENSHIRMA